MNLDINFDTFFYTDEMNDVLEKIQLRNETKGERTSRYTYYCLPWYDDNNIDEIVRRMLNDERISVLDLEDVADCVNKAEEALTRKFHGKSPVRFLKTDHPEKDLRVATRFIFQEYSKKYKGLEWTFEFGNLVSQVAKTDEFVLRGRAKPREKTLDDLFFKYMVSAYINYKEFEKQQETGYEKNLGAYPTTLQN